LAMSLATPEKISIFQRKLYRKVAWENVRDGRRPKTFTEAVVRPHSLADGMVVNGPLVVVTPSKRRAVCAQPHFRVIRRLKLY
jgi:hypothetical protein